ncbi:MAG: orotidine-5'-phosphate decarboxylase [Cyanobacteria bacterium]|nr:orotidine-5'-phosphate decarboxylase [Cyanobacteria bacterium CG_2015-16_32_12]NCO77681.1 orotidine-5'-phosphate decarboxylase [Cyanobacteria bacterium CG_2015-22_32_23]NCQ05161.1 orotidine-5'-phosphate decarboxylase [Cyanobacteria bacterium CG_2015-09_32_10]NCQ43198.1 orotidine-5'-phosphate decarboxylase [Cyanobacteria bacterium CG_2015-04_32_10]NCS83652.1 orotidine-5'-phosphate decarboxylase [Cyanobacteria bacterium CG_2015-02_32_10]
MDQDKIIVPLDVPDLDSAMALIKLLPEVSFWKVGLELFVATGADILKFLKDENKRIFLDLKFHDIPNTVKSATQSALKHQVDLLTIHATAGREALTAASEVVKNSEDTRLKLLAISVLTSINSRQLAFDLKIPLELPEYALNNALMAKECGIHGAVCSPHEAQKLKEVCGQDFLLVCPGVRPSWAIAGDQQRIMTPKKALQQGADYLVIGRPITQAQNPPEAWSKIIKEIEN